MKTTIVWMTAVLLGAGMLYAAGDAAAGKAVFEKACKNCHGATGEGNPTIAKMMKVEMKPLGSAQVQSLRDDDLKKVVTDGKGKMQPIRTVTGKSVDDVVSYVRTLKK
jgi:mono/diheme cytochrome c family protein